MALQKRLERLKAEKRRQEEERKEKIRKARRKAAADKRRAAEQRKEDERNESWVGHYAYALSLASIVKKYRKRGKVEIIKALSGNYVFPIADFCGRDGKEGRRVLVAKQVGDKITFTIVGVAKCPAK